MPETERSIVYPNWRMAVMFALSGMGLILRGAEDNNIAAFAAGAIFFSLASAWLD